MRSLSKIFIISLALLGALFLLPLFYRHPSIGGLGFGMPLNSAVWLVAVLFISWVVATQALAKQTILHRGFIYCLLFPIVLIFVGIASDVSMPIVWFFRQLYILGGFAFLWVLFQLKLNTRQVEQLLYIVVIATFIHSLVGLRQLWNVSPFGIWLPRTENDAAIGVFQQVNLHASYLATGLLIILYLISRPSFNSARFVTRLLFVITFGLAVYVLVSTGSRVGILSLVVGSAVMVVSRKQPLLRQKKIVALLVIVASLGAAAGQAGFHRAMGKAQQLTEGEFASARQTIYTISVDVITHKPLFGYGIGSFPRVWTDNVALFVAQHPEAALPGSGSLTHPHNEILFWMIEGGLVSVIGLLVIFIVLCVSLYRCGFSRGGAYAALLLPIGLHTQVELPFYISSAHWFLWLFLIFIVFRHQLIVKPINISKMARVSIQVFAVVLGLAGTAMLVHIEKSERVIFNHMYGEGADLQVALDDLYFNRFAEKLMMQSVLYGSIENNNKTSIPMFIEWAEERIHTNPERGMFQMLSDAYEFAGDTDNQCRVARQGGAIYTKNIRLKTAQEACKIK